MDEVRPEEIGGPLTLFAAQGEYKPVSFGLYPLTSLRQVTVALPEGGLVGPRGAVLGAEKLDLRLAKYSEFDDGLGKYHGGEHILLLASAVDIPAGVTRRRWLTIKVPDRQPPGDYRGHLTVRAAGRPAADWALTVKVLPSTLQDPGVWLGPYYYPPYGTTHRPFRAAPGEAVDQAILQVIEQDFRNLREHGMNLAAMDPEWGLIQYPQGQPAFNEESWQRPGNPPLRGERAAVEKIPMSRAGALRPPDRRRRVWQRLVPREDAASEDQPCRSAFYLDDVSVQAIEEPPLSVSTPLDEY